MHHGLMCILHKALNTGQESVLHKVLLLQRVHTGLDESVYYACWQSGQPLLEAVTKVTMQVAVWVSYDTCLNAQINQQIYKHCLEALQGNAVASEIRYWLPRLLGQQLCSSGTMQRLKTVDQKQKGASTRTMHTRQLLVGMQANGEALLIKLSPHHHFDM